MADALNIVYFFILAVPYCFGMGWVIEKYGKGE
jgi:hypothetical protein